MLIALLALLLGSEPSTWYEHYEAGVRLVEQGQGAAARSHLEAALAAQKNEALQMPSRPQQYIDYLPHLYLAMANQMSGDLAKARQELALAETSGIAAKSEVGRPLLVAYQLLLRGDTNVRYTKPPYAVYSQKPSVLSEEDFNTLRRDVLTKFDLPAAAKQAEWPWYANYEIGLELERKGDYPRALAHFIDAVGRRPNPQRQARMYGMWLIDYYPYFHIARSHVRLENWEGAKNALDISQRLAEIPPGSPEMDEYLSLQRETNRRLAAK
jgi:tetratricopeptide (TPR) repeat protein